MCTILSQGCGGEPKTVRLRFADTGSGIPGEDREKVFTPYFSTKATGFGLGLAITRKIVEDHAGRIYVTGEESAGTVMVVELPVAHVLVTPPVVAARSSSP